MLNSILPYLIISHPIHILFTVFRLYSIDFQIHISYFDCHSEDLTGSTTFTSTLLPQATGKPFWNRTNMDKQHVTMFQKWRNRNLMNFEHHFYGF